jgi:hypothetical protein
MCVCVVPSEPLHFIKMHHGQYANRNRDDYLSSCGRRRRRRRVVDTTHIEMVSDTIINIISSLLFSFSLAAQNNDYFIT